MLDATLPAWLVLPSLGLGVLGFWLGVRAERRRHETLEQVVIGEFER